MLKQVILSVILVLLSLCCDTSSEIQLTFLGDVIPHSLIRTAGEQKEGYAFLLSPLKELDLKKSMNFCNIETGIIHKPYPVKELYFSAKPGLIRALEENYIFNFIIANNHMLDFGAGFFKDTLINMKDKSFTGYTVSGKLHLKVIHVAENPALSIGLTGFTQLLNRPEFLNDKPPVAYFPKLNKDLLKQIGEMKKKAAFLIVSVHWGNEYDPLPGREQRRDARLLIDAGADIVWGHHPHVIEPFEIYKGKLILYSCGNFFTGQAHRDYLPSDSAAYNSNYFFSRGIPIIRAVYRNNSLSKIILISYFQFNDGFKNISKDKRCTFIYPIDDFLSLAKNYSSAIQKNSLNQHEKILIELIGKKPAIVNSVKQTGEFMRKYFFYYNKLPVIRSGNQHIVKIEIKKQDNNKKNF
ncbi:MAG: CapA family protein [Spirochaetes bacterium]|nr:CapA family protein [Spirochaetota bacterium]